MDGAIHQAAGADYLRYEEYDLHGGETGEVKETRRYTLPALAILHAIGPVVPQSVQPKHEQLLKQCYERSLDLAKEQGYRSIVCKQTTTVES